MQDKATLQDALAMMRDLRVRCDWDARQTHDSLRPYLIEEAHELDDALRSGDVGSIRDELGDMLLQVLFHSVIAEEAREFDAADVADAMVSKMRRRHPHLFGGGARVPWEKMKASSRASLADGLPSGLPSLHRAHRLQERAAGVGFDWSDSSGPAQKVEEELGEVRELLAGSPDERGLEAELGDLLFACVNLCRKAGVHAAIALDRASDKFVRRFEGVEGLAAERGLVMGEARLDELDLLWDEVKRREISPR
ncbi:MAG: nucleoside triphosphate pyrophosphohydrolase [Gemmatimonadota bacterium]|nr:nucleoside triphosphate pyrophosphohydrolase [Gemmatimonadota bacterium]